MVHLDGSRSTSATLPRRLAVLGKLSLRKHWAICDTVAKTWGTGGPWERTAWHSHLLRCFLGLAPSIHNLMWFQCSPSQCQLMMSPIEEFIWNSNRLKMTMSFFLIINRFFDICDLVGGLEHGFYFPYIGNNHPNWLIFFRGVETTNQWYFRSFKESCETCLNSTKPVWQGQFLPWRIIPGLVSGEGNSGVSWSHLTKDSPFRHGWTKPTNPRNINKHPDGPPSSLLFHGLFHIYIYVWN